MVQGMYGELVAWTMGRKGLGSSLVRLHGETTKRRTWIDLSKNPRGFSLPCLVPLSKAPYSPNICSPGAVHGCLLLCVSCTRWVKSREGSGTTWLVELVSGLVSGLEEHCCPLPTASSSLLGLSVCDGLVINASEEDTLPRCGRTRRRAASVRLLEHLKSALEEYMVRLPKVRIMRTKKREGLIRTRLLGAAAAKGEVITFLDSHCEANVNWLPPLLDRIAKNRKTIVCPMIDVIDHDNFGYETQAGDAMRGAFDWEMYYKRIPIPAKLQNDDPSEPFESPVMAGGLFAVNTKWFWELGGYDTGLEIWGGEQYEISFKVWMCGGRMEDIPCSRVGHIYRKYVPYKVPGGVSLAKWFPWSPVTMEGDKTTELNFTWSRRVSICFSLGGSENLCPQSSQCPSPRRTSVFPDMPSSLRARQEFFPHCSAPQRLKVDGLPVAPLLLHGSITGLVGDDHRLLSFDPLVRSVRTWQEAQNLKRVAEVWMDEYAEYIYQRRPEYRHLSAGDMTVQKDLRSRLNCKNFKWFMSEVAWDLPKHYPPVEPPAAAWGEIRNVGSDMCMESKHFVSGSPVRLETCIKGRGEVSWSHGQVFTFGWREDVRVGDPMHTKKVCFDAVSHNSPVTLYDCHGMKGNQLWRYRKDKSLYHSVSNGCIDSSPTERRVFMNTCDSSSPSQQWIFEKTNATMLEQFNQDAN
ncbi:unnamed protein product [Pleuronectes platessa]|uniref:Polypeptide N-acetylgalactosaminyltransferase n=1 Tax=Pleuronectes platessa TaxID=8262 RepID=A0A9N7THF0_PLEPL|nr:unnamed protein product [Pleuronectes platessa]